MLKTEPLESYAGRHWRGELSLGQSFWVNLILLHAVLVLPAWAAVQVWGESHASTLYPVLKMYSFLLVAVRIWQVVGVWRAAGAHADKSGSSAWCVVARVAVVLATTGFFYNLYQDLIVLFR